MINEQDESGKEKNNQILKFKVAKIEGFSIFCDWTDVKNPENGGVDLERLKKQDSEIYNE